MYYEKAIVSLVDRYCAITESNGFPKNAWSLDMEDKMRVLPAIPFVGRHYFEQPRGRRVLLYASAENLTWCTNPDNESYYCHREGMLRCRDNFENQKESQPDEFEFPNVHIEPIHDGGLLIAASYIMRKHFNYECLDMPMTFVEDICCANYGKFTIRDEDNPKTNMDYASNKELLNPSQPYVSADIEILDPDIIIMPKTMFWSGQNELLKKIATGKTVVCIPQINATTVNCHLFDKKKIEQYKEIQLTENEKAWLDQLHGFSKDSFMSVYDYIDSDKLYMKVMD